jgi:MoxR-like ATPase
LGSATSIELIMDDKQKDQKQISDKPISSEELDYLYSLYQASQRGAGVKMTKEEVKKLIESERLKKSNDNDKKENTVDRTVLKAATFITYVLVKKTQKLLEMDMGDKKWNAMNPVQQEQLIWMEFVKKYTMSPLYLKKFFVKLINMRENK